MIKDPHYKKELTKYNNPIPSRKFILSNIAKQKLSYKQLIKLFGLNQSQYKPLKMRLRAMVRDQELSCNKNGMYRVFSLRGLLTGEVVANRRGFGFVKISTNNKDLRLSASQMQLCFNGDKVKARLLNNELDAEIVEIISHKKNLVARVKKVGLNHVAIIDDKCTNHQVLIDINSIPYQENDLVLLNIIKNPTKNSLAVGKIVANLGFFENTNLAVQSALLRFNIPCVFNDDVEKELASIGGRLSAKDKMHRIDLTHLDFVTVDGDNSYDFDDAVFAKKHHNNWELFVAIADVSHYVAKNSAIDKESLKRGNSVYFYNAVIPMLPTKLSNNLCSLREGVIRAVLVCKLTINNVGRVCDFTFFNAYIKSKKRLTYTQVDALLIKNNNAKNKTIANVVNNLYSVYRLLKRHRKKLGLIDFESSETVFCCDKNAVKSIQLKKRGLSSKIIEECMLVANKAAGEFLTKNNANFLYRSHPVPTKENMLNLKRVLKNYNIELVCSDIPQAQDFAKVLKKIHDKPNKDILKNLVLRAMSRASYTNNDSYHFGLCFTNYTHFTSPIRRYADIITHRAIKNTLANKPQDALNKKNIALHISQTEKKAEVATRDVESWLKCLYAKSMVGNKCNGVVVAITHFGMFVKLDKLVLEGLVSIDDLAGYFIYDKHNMMLKNKWGTKFYKLGDSLRLLISSVDLERRELRLLVL